MPSTATISALLDRYAGILLDVYGVLLDGSGVLPGARELIAELERRALPYAIVTNDASRSIETYVARFARLGLPIAGERIPTLAQALATIPPGRTMFVEIKTGRETARAIADVIRTALPTNATVALQGFDPDALGALAAALPDALAYWTVDPPLDEADQPLPYTRALIDEATRRGLPALALDHRGVTDEFLAAARNAGLLVDVWTVNEPPLLAAWAARDVRWIETDHPELAPER
ncbi:MAG TPA: glycerophosphodiester phosphodiesterase family protein [Kofleriaceae bacterium]|nr:glycerophosphodiester phosphodiesterase family protein [Kofleriaceae bacterium]